MRVLLLFPHFNTPAQASSLRSWQIGRFLAQQGHEVTVFAPGVDMRSEDTFPGMGGGLYTHFEIDGVHVIRPRSLTNFRRSPYARLAFEFLYAGMVFTRAVWLKKPDVVVASSPPALAAPFGWLLARLRRVPFVYEVRDLFAEYLNSLSYLRSRRVQSAALKMEKMLAQRADHMIAVSPGIKRVLQRYGAPENRVTVVPNGYERSIFETADRSWLPRQEFGWGDRFVVIYAGALTQSYDTPTLLKAAKSLKSNKNILFVVIGEGNRKQEYIEYAEKNDLNCQFLHYQERHKLPTILSAANVGVHLFRDDDIWSVVLGNKTFDYLGSGIPMLYAGTGDTADIIKKAQAGLVVQPEDYEAFAEAVLWLEAHEEEREAMGVRGRAFVQEHYDRQKLLRDFEQVLRDITPSSVT